MLRTHKLGEADRIVTVLTRRTGKVRGVAKGVRRTTSRFGARLEPFTHVDLQLHTGRTLDVITQAETIRPYGEALVVDYPRYTAGVAMLETADRLVMGEKEPALRQFLLLVGGLRTLGSGSTRPGSSSTPTSSARWPSPATPRPSNRVPGARPPRCGRSPSWREAWSAGPAVPPAPRCPRGDPGPDDRAPAGRLARRRRLHPPAPRRVQRPGRGLPSMASRTRHTLSSTRRKGACHVNVRPPVPHPSGATPPPIPRDLVPRHVAIVMDGNGRWAKQRGLPRTEGHKGARPRSST